jgi:hypothetical protein
MTGVNYEQMGYGKRPARGNFEEPVNVFRETNVDTPTTARSCIGLVTGRRRLFASRSWHWAIVRHGRNASRLRT